MRLKLQKPLVCFDLETTGVDTQTDRIVEVGFVKLSPDGSRERLCERVDPGVDIPDGAAKVHGIRTEDVRGLFGKPPLTKVADQLLEFLGDADLCGFNAVGYDYPLWLAECARHNIPFVAEGRRMVDAMLIFHAKEPGWDAFLMGPRNLTAALRHYCGRELVGAHSADADAEATIDVLLAQLERYQDLPDEMDGLHAQCKELQKARAGTAAH